MAEYINPQWRLPNEKTGNNKGYSMNFSGQQINSSSNLGISGASPRTFSAWIKTTDAGGGWDVIVATGNTGNTGNNFELDFRSGKITFNDWGTDTFSGATVNDGNWHNICLTYNGTILKLYIDGIEDTAGDFPATKSVSSTDTPVRIGGMNHNSKYFNGQIYGVAIFDYALPAIGSNSVATLYNSGTPFNPMALSSPPVAYYPLGNSAHMGSNYLTPNGALQDYVFDFDSDYIDFGTSLGDSLGSSYSGDLTVSMWLKFDSISTQNGLFYIGDLAGGGGSFWINSSISRLWLQANNGTAGYAWCDISSLNTTDWYNLTCVYKGYDIANSKIYINNVPQTLTTYGNFNYTYDFTGKKTTIGDYYNTPPLAPFYGEMSNVQVFNTALIGSEVETLYNYGSPIQTLANIPQNSNLKAWYKLDATEIYNLLSVDGFSATDNTGGGGGGGGSKFVSNPLYVGSGGSGGSGIVVLKYPTNLNAAFSAGLTKSDVINGSNTITSIKSGTGTVAFGNAGTISDYLIVAGGGGGGGAVNLSNGEAGGGGGGGGGLLNGTSLSVSAQSYNITIGEGGSGGLKTTGGTIGSQGENGQDSIFSTFTAIGGGGGGAGQVGSNALSAGKNGGSGGGPGGSSGALTSAGGTGSQGSDGSAASNKRAGGGGGGYSNTGTAATSNEVPGNGGNGYLYSLTSTYYAGGGGAGVWHNTGTAPSGGLSGDGSTGIGGAPKQQGDITPEGPNFTDWWKILDDSNNSNDGASSGMSQSNLIQSDLLTTSSYSPYAMSFDGNDRINLGLESDLNIGSASKCSTSLWFKKDDENSGCLWGYNYGDASGSGYYFWLNSGNLRIAVGKNGLTGSFGYYQISSSDLPVGVWQNIVVVFDGTLASGDDRIKVYQNGNLSDGTYSDSSNFPTTLPDGNGASNRNVYLGQLQLGNGNFSYDFNGEISNVSIWNTNLTVTQAREIYNKGLPSNLHNFSGTAPVAWWQLGSNSSFAGNWTVLDEIGSNDGTSNGMLESAIVDGVGTSGNGVSTNMSFPINISGSSPNGEGNSLSVNMTLANIAGGVN